MASLPSIERFDVDVRGGSLVAYRMGAEEGPLVIAVHGITSNSHSWLPVAASLDGSVRLIAPDIRGRASSRELPAPFGLGAHAQDLRALLDHLGAERAVFAGHSLGAYIVAQFAATHPDRVSALVLVDGGLRIPGSEGADPQEFTDRFLGPTLARLKMTFPTLQAYLDWWHQHPAFIDTDVDEDFLKAYVEHDTVGQAPELRSSVAEAAVRGDAAELASFGEAAERLTHRAVLLCAPRGLQNNPEPMQPFALAQQWASLDANQRAAILVEDVNHYTITLGARGAAAVADAVRSSLTRS
jgi:pimeloyl-ACP methyl ester carboxylesterase